MTIKEFIKENRDWFNCTPPENVIKYLMENLLDFALNVHDVRKLVILLCINNHFPIMCYYSDSSLIWTFKVWDIKLLQMYKYAGSPAVDLAEALGLNQYIPHLKSLITLEKI